MEFDLYEAQRAFSTQGYYQIPFDVPADAVQRAINSFFTFLALPDEDKRRYGFRIKFNEADEHDRGTDLGYHFRRSETGAGHDDKEYIHYNTECRRRFNHPNAPKALQVMLQDMDVVYQSVINTMRPVAQAIESHTGQALIDLDGPLSVLRFLKYDHAGVGNFLASGHYDRNTCSLAIAESAPGLRIGVNPEQLQEVTHQPGTAILFPSLMLEDRTNREFRASWHDVIQKPEAAFRPDAARWAIVFFAVPNDVSPYWNKTLTRTKRS